MVMQARPVPALDGIERLVVVPLMPGRLVDVAPPASRSRDEIDGLLDDWFGDELDEPIGWLDAGLVLVGIALIGWGLLSGWQGPLPWVGVVLTGLGLAIPIRELAGLARTRRSRRAMHRVIGDGYVVNADHPVTADLLEAYAACLGVAAKSAGPTESVIEAAHQAVVEVATLLGGRRPSLRTETDYIRARDRAIRSLTLALRRRNRAVRVAHGSAGRLTAESAFAWADVPAARDELSAETGLGALERIDAAAAALMQEADDATR